MGKLINWKVFWVLLGTSVLGIVCTLPYTLTVQAGLLEELPIPLDLLLTLQIVQNIVLFAFFILAGLYLAGKVGFRTPVLERWSRGEEVESALKSILWVSIIRARAKYCTGTKSCQSDCTWGSCSGVTCSCVSGTCGVPVCVDKTNPWSGTTACCPSDKCVDYYGACVGNEQWGNADNANPRDYCSARALRWYMEAGSLCLHQTF
jgi:hypothetical protein